MLLWYLENSLPIACEAFKTIKSMLQCPVGIILKMTDIVINLQRVGFKEGIASCCHVQGTSIEVHLKWLVVFFHKIFQKLGQNKTGNERIWRNWALFWKSNFIFLQRCFNISARFYPWLLCYCLISSNHFWIQKQKSKKKKNKEKTYLALFVLS